MKIVLKVSLDNVKKHGDYGSFINELIKSNITSKEEKVFQKIVESSSVADLSGIYDSNIHWANPYNLNYHHREIIKEIAKAKWFDAIEQLCIESTKFQELKAYYHPLRKHLFNRMWDYPWELKLIVMEAYVRLFEKIHEGLYALKNLREFSPEKHGKVYEPGIESRYSGDVANVFYDESDLDKFKKIVNEFYRKFRRIEMAQIKEYKTVEACNFLILAAYKKHGFPVPEALKKRMKKLLLWEKLEVEISKFSQCYTAFA